MYENYLEPLEKVNAMIQGIIVRFNKRRKQWRKWTTLGTAIKEEKAHIPSVDIFCIFLFIFEIIIP